MADWTAYVIPAGSLLVAASTFAVGVYARRAERARQLSLAADAAKTKALEDAKDTGRREAIAMVEEQRRTSLLAQVEAAEVMVGTPQEMADWKDTVERRLNELEGRGRGVSEIRARDAVIDCDDTPVAPISVGAMPAPRRR